MRKTIVASRPLFRLDGALVKYHGDLVDKSGVCDLLDSWRREDGHDPSKGGRPAIFSDRSILILFSIVANSGHPLHLMQLANLVCREESTDLARELLGLPGRESAQQSGESYRVYFKLWYDRIWRGLHRILQVIDPFDYVPEGRRLTKSELDEAMLNRDEAKETKRWERATILFNRLIMASVGVLPEENQKNWCGDVAIDATLIKAARSGNPRNPQPHQLMSSHPMAGWYVREGDHLGTPKALKRTKSEISWGYEATVVAGVLRDQGPHKQPHLIIGMSMDRPGHKPAERALQALAHIINDPDAPRGEAVTDRAYFPMARVDKYHIPMRKAGYTLIGDYPEENLGQTHSYQTMIMVEGGWYCRTMPQVLIDGTKDFRAGIIDQETYERRIAERGKYAMRRKGKDDTGDSSVQQCPARGPGKTLNCPHTEEDEREDAKRKRLLRLLDLQVPQGELGACCTNRTSVTIPHSEGMKYRQTGPAYKSPEWQRKFAKSRNIIETRNDLIKNSRGGAEIGDTTRRLVRGFIAAWLFTALGIVAVNLMLIRNFLERVSLDLQVAPTPEPPPPVSHRREFDHSGNAPPLHQAS